MRKLLLLLAIVLTLTGCASSRAEENITRLLAAQESADATYASTEEAYGRYGDDVRVAYNWAYILLSSGETERALEVIERAIADNPTTLRFYYLRARAIYQSGRHQSYLAALEEILSFDPANTDVMLTLADYHMKHFHADLARVWAGRVLTYEPTNSRAVSIMATGDDFYASIAGRTTQEEVYDNPFRIPGFNLQTPDIDKALETFSGINAERELLFVPLNTAEEPVSETI